MAGADGQRIIAAIAELNRELGYSEERARQSARWERSEGDSLLALPREECEELVAGVRAGLARLAATAAGGGEEGEGASAVLAALAGIDLVMRGEILLGNTARLEAMVPSFAFLATLPVSGKGQALAHSRRLEELLEAPGS